MAPQLVPTTRKSHLKEMWTLNYHVWGAPYHTEIEYFRREVLLRQTAFSQKRLITWILIDLEADKPEILSACETYRYECASAVDGITKKGSCFAIASVFTPPAHRKLGYAAKMLTDLLALLKSFRDCIATTLYSDIGPEFYSKLGWETYPSVSLRLEISNETFIPPKHKSTRYLSITDIKSIFQSQAHKLLVTLAQTTKPTFAIFPCYEAQEWLYVRAVFYAKKKSKRISHSGIQSGKDFVTWTHDFNDSTLLVTHAYINSCETAKLLLQGAMLEAKIWGLKRIDLWDPSDDLVRWSADACSQFKVSSRTLSLPCLAYWGGGGAKPDWILNETFAWV